MHKHELLTLIEHKRNELLKAASKYGLSSSTTIQYSQQLDKLLNEYNQRSPHKSQSR